MSAQDIKLFIGMPCYGGQMYYTTMLSILELADTCKHVGLGGFTVHALGNESLVQRGRNRIVSAFMGTKATHLLFVDADISFSSQSVMDMLASGFELTVGSYPKKEIIWDNINSAVRNNIPVKDLPPLAASHVLNLPPGDTQNMATVGSSTFVEVMDGGTGFMLISRSVIEKLMAAYPETKYEKDGDESYSSDPYALFDCIIEPESRRYLSEDYTFCRRWQKIGGKVWCCLSAKLNHTGTYVFQGNVAAALGIDADYDDLPIEFDTIPADLASTIQ